VDIKQWAAFKKANSWITVFLSTIKRVHIHTVAWESAFLPPSWHFCVCANENEKEQLVWVHRLTTFWGSSCKNGHMLYVGGEEGGHSNWLMYCWTVPFYHPKVWLVFITRTKHNTNPSYWDVYLRCFQSSLTYAKKKKSMHTY
jgi:hypothetical protein